MQHVLVVINLEDNASCAQSLKTTLLSYMHPYLGHCIHHDANKHVEEYHAHDKLWPSTCHRQLH